MLSQVRGSLGNSTYPCLKHHLLGFFFTVVMLPLSVMAYGSRLVSLKVVSGGSEIVKF